MTSATASRGGFHIGYSCPIIMFMVVACSCSTQSNHNSNDGSVCWGRFYSRSNIERCSNVGPYSSMTATFDSLPHFLSLFSQLSESDGRFQDAAPMSNTVGSYSSLQQFLSQFQSLSTNCNAPVSEWVTVYRRSTEGTFLPEGDSYVACSEYSFEEFARAVTAPSKHAAEVTATCGQVLVLSNSLHLVLGPPELFTPDALRISVQLSSNVAARAIGPGVPESLSVSAFPTIAFSRDTSTLVALVRSGSPVISLLSAIGVSVSVESYRLRSDGQVIRSVSHAVPEIPRASPFEFSSASSRPDALRRAGDEVRYE